MKYVYVVMGSVGEDEDEDETEWPVVVCATRARALKQAHLACEEAKLWPAEQTRFLGALPTRMRENQRRDKLRRHATRFPRRERYRTDRPP